MADGQAVTPVLQLLGRQLNQLQGISSILGSQRVESAEWVQAVEKHPAILALDLDSCNHLAYQASEGPGIVRGWIKTKKRLTVWSAEATWPDHDEAEPTIAAQVVDNFTGAGRNHLWTSIRSGVWPCAQ